MTWMAPWALLGLLAVAAPVLVHWLARHQAMRLRFPTIQFLVRSSPVSVRRYRLREWPLLAVRAGIIAAAAIALAQPVWVRPGAPAARPARAIVLDTSASLRRTLADGRVGADVAHETAAAASGGTGTPATPEAPTVTVATERLSEGVAQAAAWLATQTSPRELVVVSDFQVGALVESDLDTVPEDADVRLLPIAVSGPVPAAPAPARGRLRVLAGREDAGLAAAAEAAARAIEPVADSPAISDGLNRTSGPLDVVVVFASGPERDAMRRSAQPVDTPELFGWVADIKRELRRLDPANELVADYQAISYELISGLAVFTTADPGSAQAAALMAAILRAAAPPALTVAEREPDTLAPAALQGWQRIATPTSSPGRAGDRTDGRWFWALALALFGLEAWMRRRPANAHSEAAHADAA